MGLPKLEFLTITLDTPFTSAEASRVDQSDERLWNQIDQIVITQFPYLQDLRFVLNSETQKKAILEKLPKATSRGMVTLVLCSCEACNFDE